MTLDELLTFAADKKVKIWQEEGRLFYDAPRGLLSGPMSNL